MSASHPSIDCDGGTGGQVIADPRDNPFHQCPLPARGGRHHRNGGRLEIGTVGAITSERWAASDWNRWAAYVGIRTSDEFQRRRWPFRLSRYVALQANHPANLAVGALLVGVTKLPITPSTPRDRDLMVGAWARRRRRSMATPISHGAIPGLGGAVPRPDAAVRRRGRNVQPVSCPVQSHRRS